MNARTAPARAYGPILALLLLTLGLTPAAHAEAPATERRGPESAAIAIALEVLSPLGGPGCIYRRRPLPFAIVTAGSLLSGGMLLYALHQGDRDATIINAIAYGVMRALGVAAAAQPSAPVLPARLPDAASRAGALPATTGRTLGLSYGLSF